MTRSPPYPIPSFLTKQSHWLCSPNCQRCLLFECPSSIQVFPPALLVPWGRLKLCPAGGAVSQHQAGAETGEATPATLDLPDGLARRGQEPPSGWAMNEPPAVCGTASLHTQHCLCSWDNQLCLPVSQREHPWATASRSGHQTSGTGRPSPQHWCLTQHFAGTWKNKSLGLANVFV